MLAKVAMKGRPIISGPVQLTITCCFGGKDRGWHVNKPDLDNCAKAAADGMCGIIFLDDRQIASLICRKINGLRDEVEIFVEPLHLFSNLPSL